MELKEHGWTLEHFCDVLTTAMSQMSRLYYVEEHYPIFPFLIQTWF